MIESLSEVWVFLGNNALHPSAIFTTKTLAEDWICKFRVSGVLTAYPLDVSLYDWAISQNYFSPSKSHQKEAAFIGRFSSAAQEHYHYEDGALVA